MAIVRGANCPTIWFLRFPASPLATGASLCESDLARLNPAHSFSAREFRFGEAHKGIVGPMAELFFELVRCPSRRVPLFAGVEPYLGKKLSLFHYAGRGRLAALRPELDQLAVD